MAETKAQAPATRGNQTESEFLALVPTGVKAIENIFGKYGKTIMQRAAPNLKDDGAFGVWSSRVIFEITSNEALTRCLNTKEGVISAYKSITRAGVLGLMVGGLKPQTYFVERGGKIGLDIADRGMEFACVYGPGAVLKKTPELVKIHENDGYKIDQAAGRIIFPDSVEVFGSGALVGYAMELEYLDGRREVARVTLQKVKQIEDKYGQKNSPLYSKSPEEADEKTARKQLLKRAFSEAEGRAMALGLGGAFMPEVGQAYADPEPPEPDMEDRVGDRLDRAARDVSPKADSGEAGELDLGEDGRDEDAF